MKKVLALLGLDLLLSALITLQWSGKIPTLRELSTTLSKAYLPAGRQAWGNIELTPLAVVHQVQGVLGLRKLPPLPSTPTATSSASRQKESLRAENEQLAQELTKAQRKIDQLLDLGKLDNHQGFDDFKPAEKFKYELVGENLAQGYTTTYDVIYKGWLGSPGHHLLLSDPRLTLGCTTANRGVTVLIAGKEH